MTTDELESILQQHPELAIEDYSTFVETGTYGGDTTVVAAKLFRKVITIEAGPHYSVVKDRLALSAPNATCLFGRSEDVLPTLDLPERAVFYLDAHDCGIKDDDWSTNSLNLELDFLASRLLADTIIIDDAGMFGGYHGPKQDWREFTQDRTIRAFGGYAKDGGRVLRTASMHNKYIVFLKG